MKRFAPTYLRGQESGIRVPVPRDASGLTSRKCPLRDCGCYFKIRSGIGLTGDGIPCHCPYCGHAAPPDEFTTPEQIAYAEAVALRRVQEALHQDLKSMEFTEKIDGPLGFRISMEFKPGPVLPIHGIVEKRLETQVTCDGCTLEYAIYGLFAFCPDCRRHNSLQILGMNVDVLEKELALADELKERDSEVSERLVANALNGAVSAFDGFGREICRVYQTKATDPAKAGVLSFQNPEGARKNVLDLFGFDFTQGLTPQENASIIRGFQKRHLLAHRMGIVDEVYMKATGDPAAVVGRKIRVTQVEVREVLSLVRRLGTTLSSSLA